MRERLREEEEGEVDTTDEADERDLDRDVDREEDEEEAAWECVESRSSGNAGCSETA